jgi:hypothetical protein
VQSGMVETQFGVGLDPRILAESDSGVEISESHASCQVDRTFVQGVVFSLVAGRRGDRYGGGRRNVEVLERF